MNATGVTSTPAAASPRRSGLDLAAGLAAWLVCAAVGSVASGVAILVFLALGGAGPETDRGAIEFLVGYALVIWFVGAWMTIDWWLTGRQRLWPLPLVLLPLFTFLWPFGFVLFSPGFRRAVLPRSPPQEGQAREAPRLLGLPRWALPLAVVFWVFAVSTGLGLMLLFISGVRRTVVPRRAPPDNTGASTAF